MTTSQNDKARRFRALHNRVGERKPEAHEQGRDSELDQHRPGVEPQLRERSTERGIRARAGRTADHREEAGVGGHDRFEILRIGGRQTGERERDEESLHHHQPLRGPPRAPSHIGGQQ